MIAVTFNVAGSYLTPKYYLCKIPSIPRVGEIVEFPDSSCYKYVVTRVRHVITGSPTGTNDYRAVIDLDVFVSLNEQTI